MKFCIRCNSITGWKPSYRSIIGLRVKGDFAMLEDVVTKARLEEETIFDVVFTKEDGENVDMSGVKFENVVFHKCRLINCLFVKTTFYNSVFEDCDLSGCNFTAGYWKSSKIVGSKGSGSNFKLCTFKNFELVEAKFQYGNFINSLWEAAKIIKCELSESCFAETKFRSISFSATNLTKVDFFKTSLKGIDLSTCVIVGLITSDTYYELKGLKVNAMQAVDLSLLLGIKVV